ncbi:hypothetical protein MVEN_01621200 [Mycena venus]|uniref:Uncharacterized protein n=1 Tax=Mycena venus TaxID=2733690 RepID=A0A8H7CRZ4_9AGAR|nr:hypothetical protein MVEN_01621200 [Mycena venus]
MRSNAGSAKYVLRSTSAAGTGMPRHTQSDSQTIHNYIHGGVGGHGGAGHVQGIGGRGGAGEGPTFNYSIRANRFTLNNHNIDSEAEFSLESSSDDHESPSAPYVSEFRTFPIGDINLIKEIRWGGQSGVVDRYRQGPSLRQMYSAKVGDRCMTIAMYQGDRAEEEWRKEVAKYKLIR